ncbi:hypothetical protein RUM43_007009 [Polyplax serrata]|uniref:Uncharacterized protein n=1 Tax=Polyplax serrata TaxID=468196 RepID=A0AAN8PBZ9_POLSC
MARHRPAALEKIFRNSEDPVINQVEAQFGNCLTLYEELEELCLVVRLWPRENHPEENRQIAV